MVITAAALLLPLLSFSDSSLTCTTTPKTLGYSRARQKVFSMEDKYRSIYDRNYEIRNPVDYGKVNIEHVFPQSWLHEYLEDAEFNRAKADMHHLFPVDVTTNSRRGNREYRDGCSKDKQVGQICGGGFEPPEEVKGIVARATLYISEQYGIPIPEGEIGVVQDWNSKYPVTPWEISRDSYVYSVQRNHNPFIYCRQ